MRAEVVNRQKAGEGREGRSSSRHSQISQSSWEFVRFPSRRRESIVDWACCIWLAEVGSCGRSGVRLGGFSDGLRRVSRRTVEGRGHHLKTGPESTDTLPGSRRGPAESFLDGDRTPPVNRDSLTRVVTKETGLAWRGRRLMEMVSDGVSKSSPLQGYPQATRRQTNGLYRMLERRKKLSVLRVN